MSKTPKISVLLASYGPQSQRYLDLCFKSLAAQTFKDFEVIHVSSGEYLPHHLTVGPMNLRHEHSPGRLHFPSAIAEAYELSDPDTEYILLLNDDVIMQKHCLEVLLMTLKAAPWTIVNPKSNCDDNGRFYCSLTPFEALQYRIDDMEKLCDSVIDFHSNQTDFLLVRQPQVHFYCTLMTRKCWTDVGGIDTNLKTGFDDADFCKRAVQKFYSPCIAMHAYALHGSGVSADIHITQEDRDFNQKYFFEKHK